MTTQQLTVEDTLKLLSDWAKWCRENGKTDMLALLMSARGIESMIADGKGRDEIIEMWGISDDETPTPNERKTMSQTTKTTIQVELKPFQTPSYVIVESKAGLRQEGMMEPAGYPLSVVDAETLNKLCNDFRDEVFRKAGKIQPPTCVQG